eukprot:8150266-Heterocapsa_arctica.AAC.1
MDSGWEDEAYIHSLIEWLRALAKQAAGRAAYSRTKAWHDWAREATTAHGARKAFRWIKEAPPWVPAVACATWGSAGLQADAQEKATPWHDLWSLGKGLEGLQWPHLGAGCHGLAAYLGS